MSLHGPQDPSRSMSYASALLAVTWTFAAISTAGLCARLLLRWNRFGRLHWDDFFVSLAWAFSIPLAVQVTVSLRHVRNADVAPLKDSIFLSRPLVQFFFYSSAWSVKLSFLLFFRRIGITILRGVTIYWRLVLAFTILSYLITWSLNPYDCWVRMGIRRCAADPVANRLWAFTFPLAASLDLLTDLLIMVIPFAVLAHVRLSNKQRLVLYSLFSLVILTMSVAIARVVIAMHARSQNDLTVTLIIFLANVEANTAIFVACIGSVRTLFTQNDGSQTPAYQRPYLFSLKSFHRPRSDSTAAIVTTELQNRPRDSLKSSVRMEDAIPVHGSHASVEPADMKKT